MEGWRATREQQQQQRDREVLVIILTEEDEEKEVFDFSFYCFFATVYEQQIDCGSSDEFSVYIVDDTFNIDRCHIGIYDIEKYQLRHIFSIPSI